jgi:calcineurin-like phosphoesterase family protein
MPTIKIAVLSDMHFFTKHDDSIPTSYLPMDGEGQIFPANRGSGKNPWDDLVDLINSDQLTCDLVLCPGDITTRADQKSLKAGWKHLQELGRMLEARTICAATGNHDVCSRSQRDKLEKNVVTNLSHSTNLVEPLKNLTPLYPAVWKQSTPAQSRETQTKYFGESFVLLDHDDSFRVLTLNSCADHGHDDFEYEKGSAPESALRWLKEDLPNLPDNKINIMLCHHPVQSQTLNDGSAYDFLTRGDKLLACLEKSGFWLVIHGHKHFAYLCTGPSTRNKAPIIFSAASFSAVMPVPEEEGNENQFYIIEITKDEGSPMSATIHAWHWNVGFKWKPTPPGKTARIHFGAGFGSTATPRQIADIIAQQYKSGVTSWSDVLKSAPDLNYVMPPTLQEALTELTKHHKLFVNTDEEGWHTLISRAR